MENDVSATKKLWVVKDNQIIYVGTWQSQNKWVRIMRMPDLIMQQ